MFDKRRIITSIGKILLKFFVLTLILVYGLSQVTEYNTLKPIVTELVTKMMGESQATGSANQKIVEALMQRCRNTDKIDIPLGYESLIIDCREVRAKGGEAALSQSVSDIIMKDYYKDYNCAPVGCITSLVSDRKPENMAYIFSAQMNQFLKTLVPYFIIGIVLSVLIIIYSIKETFPIFKEIGAALLGAGFPFLMLVLILYREQLLVSTGILSGRDDFIRITNELLSGPVYNVANMYLYMYGAVFITGVVLTVTGYIGIKRKPATDAKKADTPTSGH